MPWTRNTDTRPLTLPDAHFVVLEALGLNCLCSVPCIAVEIESVVEYAVSIRMRIVNIALSTPKHVSLT